MCETPGCSAAYHLGCLSPPLPAVPSGTWFCPECDNPLAEVEKLLDSRAVAPSSAHKAASPRSTRTEFYVKFKARRPLLLRRTHARS